MLRRKLFSTKDSDKKFYFIVMPFQ